MSTLKSFERYGRVLICSILSGMGHKRAGDAIMHGIEMLDSTTRVRHINVLNYIPVSYRLIYKEMYEIITKNIPAIYSILYHASKNKVPKVWKTFHQTARMHRMKNLHAFIDGFEPDVILSTHYVTSMILSEMKRMGIINAPLIGVCTDFGLHAYLVRSHIDMYLLPTQRTAQCLMDFGWKKPYTVTGMPVEPSIIKEVSHTQLYREWGLRPDCKTILLIGTNFSSSLIDSIFRQFQKVSGSIQVIALAGRQKAPIRYLRRKEKKYNFTIRVFGFTDRILDMMKIADLVISKPGAMTVAEILSSGTPFIALKPIPGQERINIQMLEEEGAARMVTHITRLPAAINEMLYDVKTVEHYRRNILRLAKPNATFNIAALILSDFISKHR